MPARCASRFKLWSAVSAALAAQWVNTIVAPAPALAVTRYWDTDGATAGPGANPVNGTWGTGVANWSTSSTGGAATAAWPAAGVGALDTAQFSAGTTATGAFTITVDTVTVQAIALQEGTPTFSGGTITFAAGGSQVFTAVNSGSTTNATINSQIAGAAGLRVSRFGATGGGTVTLGGTTNNWTGALTVDAGNTVTLGAAGVVPDGSLVTLNTGTFNLNGFNETVRGLVAAGAGPVSLGGGTLTLSVPGVESHTYAGAISGAGGLVKSGTGTQLLSAASAFTGQVQVNDGVLNVSQASALGTTAGNTVVNAGGTLRLSGASAIIAEPLTLNGTGFNNAGALNAAGGTKTYSGAITLGSSGVRINTDNPSLNITGGINPIAGLSDPNTTFGGSNQTSISTLPLNIGAGTLTKDGAGTLILNVAGNVLGGINLQAGRLNFGISNPAAGATINVSNAAGISVTSTAVGVTVANDFVLAAGANPVTLWSLLAGQELTLTGAISGGGSFVRSDTGAGNVTLAGPNTFAGGVTVRGRGIILGHRDALGTGTLTLGDAVTAPTNPIAISANVALAGADAVDNAIVVHRDFTVGGTTDSAGGAAPLELSGPIDLGAATRIVMVSNTGGVILSGVVSGGAGSGLTKTGSDTMTMTAANTYAGDTSVVAGTLAVASEASLGTSANAIQLAGGTLRTNAPIAFARNAVATAASGGIDTAGSDSSIGTITGAGAFAKGGAGKLTAGQVKLGGALAVTGGALEIAAEGGASRTVQTTALTISAGGALRLNDNDVIIDYTGASPEAAVRQYVVDARVPLSTSGIFSTPGSPDDDVVLAVADNVAWGKSALNGINIDTDTVVGKYTYFGDANLDGKVTGDDYLNVDANLGTGDSWLEGDFNMSGVTTGDDYLAIDANLGKGTPDPLAFAELKEEMVALHAAMFGEEYLVNLAAAEADGFGASVVPEPAAMSLVTAAGLLLPLSRRARRIKGR